MMTARKHPMLLLAGLVLMAGPQLHSAHADSWPPELSLYQAFPGNAELDIGGSASLAVMDDSSPRQPWASGDLKLTPRLHRDYDSGLVLGLNATLAVGDRLSRGRYGGNFLEKAYGQARTGLGTLEVGMTDGAGYALAVSGPVVDGQVALDDPQTVFFRDSATRRPVGDIFALRTQVGASANYAKFAYLSPALFGAQVALSFTPSQGKDGLPFVSAGPPVNGRQADIWEAALRYSDDFGPVTLTGSAALAEGRAEHKSPGQEGVSDIGLGLRADYAIDDDTALSLGGAWRQSNAHAFDITQSFKTGVTRVGQLSAELTHGAWSFGLESGSGTADASSALPTLTLHAYQAVLGYTLNSNILVSAGWQRQDYARSSGVFDNGLSRITMDAGFLHLNLHV
jgi:hypothetical protein